MSPADTVEPSIDLNLLDRSEAFLADLLTAWLLEQNPQTESMRARGRELLADIRQRKAVRS